MEEFAHSSAGTGKNVRSRYNNFRFGRNRYVRRAYSAASTGSAHAVEISSPGTSTARC